MHIGSNYNVEQQSPCVVSVLAYLPLPHCIAYFIKDRFGGFTPNNKIYVPSCTFVTCYERTGLMCTKYTIANIPLIV